MLDREEDLRCSGRVTFLKIIFKKICALNGTYEIILIIVVFKCRWRAKYYFDKILLSQKYLYEIFFCKHNIRNYVITNP